MNEFYTPEYLINDPVKIHLIGVGGTGSEVLEGLTRLHLALSALGHPGLHIIAWDNDTVSTTNILRQRFYPGDEGENKAVLTIHRINMLYGLDWEARSEWYTPSFNTLNNTLLITCVDKASVRAEISQFHGNCLWLDTGNGESSGQVVLGHLLRNKEPQPGALPNVVQLYPELLNHEQFDKDDTPSCSADEALSRQEFPINRMVATHALTLIWNLLRHGRIDYHGVYVDTKNGTSAPIKVDPQVWEMLGYKVQANSRRKKSR